ncbi:MAG TPA: methionine biosynthesis protein MetW [Bryobacteraceae bacterium]
MSATALYKSAFLYELLMILLYGRHYAGRYKAIADLIPAHSSVLDLCCGPAVLYHRYLIQKSVRYTGLDLSGAFIEHLKRRGANGQVWDLQRETALPEADYVVMQASLYQFLPNPQPLVDRMLRAARKQVIFAEPIRNITSSKLAPLAFLGRHFTDPGDGQSAHRFTEDTLDRFFSRYSSRLSMAFSIPGGREKVIVLHSDSSLMPAGSEKG